MDLENLPIKKRKQLQIDINKSHIDYLIEGLHDNLTEKIELLSSFIDNELKNKQKNFNSIAQLFILIMKSIGGSFEISDKDLEKNELPFDLKNYSCLIEYDSLNHKTVYTLKKDKK